MKQFNLDRWTEIQGEELKAIKGVIDRGVYILGPEVHAFEVEFARYLGVKHVVTMGSGSDALRTIFQSLPEGRILSPAFNVGYTAISIHHAGRVPAFYDVDPETMVMGTSVEGLEGSVGLCPVHLYGRLAWSEELAERCRELGILIIEDACQAHGATLKGRQAGTLGWASAFSFYPTKNLGGLGDGGAIATNDPMLAERADVMRNAGRTTRWHHTRPGLVSRLDEIQAAVLRVRLRHLDQRNQMRETAARRYCELLGKDYPSERLGVWHLFVVRVPPSKRTQVLRTLEAADLPAFNHYPIAAYRQPWLPPSRSFPIADRLAQSVVALPLFPGIAEPYQQEVVSAISRACPLREVEIQS